jgi:hypothetical protein
MNRDAGTRVRLEQDWDASERGDIETEHAICAEDAILDSPQSGERFRGRSKIQPQRGGHPAETLHHPADPGRRRALKRPGFRGGEDPQGSAAVPERRISDAIYARLRAVLAEARTRHPVRAPDGDGHRAHSVAEPGGHHLGGERRDRQHAPAARLPGYTRNMERLCRWFLPAVELRVRATGVRCRTTQRGSPGRRRPPLRPGSLKGPPVSVLSQAFLTALTSLHQPRSLAATRNQHARNGLLTLETVKHQVRPRQPSGGPRHRPGTTPGWRARASASSPRYWPSSVCTCWRLRIRSANVPVLGSTAWMIASAHT